MKPTKVRTVGELRAVLAELPADMLLWADAEAGHVTCDTWEVSVDRVRPRYVGDVEAERFGFSLD